MNLQKKSSKKILHIFLNISDNTGIPLMPFFIPFYLHKTESFKNNIITTRYNYLPDLEIIQGEIPPCEYIPIFHNGDYFFNIKFFKKILTEKPDIIILYHFFSWPSLLLLLPICKILNIKTIVLPDIDESIRPKLHISPLKTVIEIGRYMTIYLQLCLFDRIVFMSIYQQDILEKIKKIPQKKKQIIPLVIPLLSIGTGEKEKIIFTLYRKWIAQDKILETVIQQFSTIRKEENCQLYVVGKFEDEKYRKKIVDLVHDLNIEKDVVFYGRIPEKLKIELFKKAKLFYLPSPGESFGVPFIEALGSGTPIIARKNTAVEYIIQHGKTGFLENNPEEQKNKIVYLLRDQKAYTIMQNNCLKEAEKYRWETVIKKYVKLIEDL
jgi:glycosyltransferase involved in cell wall biosynthesis